MKGRKGGEIYFTRKTMEWCERYRSIRQKISKSKEDKEACFFQNFNGQPLSQIKSTRGTIWAKFEEVTGVTKATITDCVRSAAEEVIQDHPEMSNRVKQLNNHSLAVGSQVYDKNKYSYRGQFVNFMAHKEGEGNVGSGSEEDVELQAQIKKREEEDEKQNKIDAIEAVEKDKRRRHTTLSSQIRVKPEHRVFLQMLFKDLIGDRFPGYKKSIIVILLIFISIPAPKKWPRVLYRIVDGVEADISLEDLNRLRQIEMEIFKNVVKDVEKESGFDWSGTLEENISADVKVAKSLRNSFYNYEKDRKKNDPKYFVFR